MNVNGSSPLPPDLTDYLRMRRREWIARMDVCPVCRAEPSIAGEACEECRADGLQTAYEEREDHAAADRAAQWRNQTAVQRNRKHRLEKRLRPARPARPGTDPWRIADDALRELRSVRRADLRPEQAHALDRAAEMVKRLAWGPQ